MFGKIVLIVDDEVFIWEMIVVVFEMVDYDYIEVVDVWEVYVLIVDK